MENTNPNIAFVAANSNGSAPASNGAYHDGAQSNGRQGGAILHHNGGITYVDFYAHRWPWKSTYFRQLSRTEQLRVVRKVSRQLRYYIRLLEF